MKTKLIPTIVTALGLISIVNGIDTLLTTELVVAKTICILNIILWAGVLTWCWWGYNK